MKSSFVITPKTSLLKFVCGKNTKVLRIIPFIVTSANPPTISGGRRCRGHSMGSQKDTDFKSFALTECGFSNPTSCESKRLSYLRFCPFVTSTRDSEALKPCIFTYQNGESEPTPKIAAFETLGGIVETRTCSGFIDWLKLPKLFVSNPVERVSITTYASKSVIGKLFGSFLVASCFICQSVFAVKPATTTSITIPAITIHSPHRLAESHRLKESMFLNFFFSESVSNTSPTNTITPPIQANSTSPKYDVAVVSIYAVRGVKIFL